MLKIEYVSNEGSGNIESFEVAPGTTVGQVLDLKGVYGGVEDGRLVVKVNRQKADVQDELEAGDRITVTPGKVESGS